VSACAPALLYVKAGCAHCDALRADLVARGVAFREIPVDVRPETIPELLKLTGGRRVVPVLVEAGRIAVAPHGGSSV
jgi:glutaredoxin